jgi:hypothetical protein
MPYASDLDRHVWIDRLHLGKDGMRKYAKVLIPLRKVSNA